jgi:hypothetical protein
MLLKTLSITLISGVLALGSYAQNKIGNFSLVSHTDVITDRDASYILATNMSDNVDIALGFKCFDGEINAVLSHKYLGGDSDNDIIVTHRFDRQQPVRMYWRLSHGKKTSMVAYDDDGPFMAGAIRYDQVAIRIVDPLDNETLTTVINLRGSRDAFNWLVNRCR